MLFAHLFAEVLGAVLGFGTPFLFGIRMTTEALLHRLECLGWKLLAGGQRPDGRWWQTATSCGHTVVALADTRHEAWSAACAMALNLTRNGLAHDDR